MNEEKIDEENMFIYNTMNKLVRTAEEPFGYVVLKIETRTNATVKTVSVISNGTQEGIREIIKLVANQLNQALN